MSTKQVGKVLRLFISQKNRAGETEALEQEEITLDEQGVISDKFHGKELQRSVLLSSIDSYTLAETNNMDMPYGSLGENILIDFNPYHFNIGDRIQIGAVLLEITQNCTLCKGLSKVDAKAPKLLKEHRGIFAKTITNGSIVIGENVYI